MGRIVFEFMRSDDANEILGLRVNVWTSVLVFLLGLTLFWWFGKRAGAQAREPEPSQSPG
jgi:prolipoprotein diacylglyceryltransferase